MIDLMTKVALITGGSSGIGRAAAHRLAKEGWRVAVAGRTESELKKVREELEAAGAEALALVADLQSAEQMEKAYRKLIGEWGRLDTVFANGGINGVWTDLDNLSLEDWDKTLSINLRGTFLTVKLAYPHLRKQGGSIVVTSSVNGTRMFSNQGATAYAVSKAGQVALVKMLAIELAQHGVRINAICPGGIETEIEDNTEREMPASERVDVEFPEGKIPLTGGSKGSAEQVADLVHFLASDGSSHITGSVIHIDGAQSLLQG
jgi:NAD(P)-dependent dehydrogenase (short-subunit alcohol dehydrogenase family)